MYLSGHIPNGRGPRSSGLGIIQTAIDVATLIDAVSGAARERARKKGIRISQQEDNLLLSSRRYADGRHEGFLPPSPFGALGAMSNYIRYPGAGGETPKTPMNIARWPPAGKKTGLTAFEMEAVKQYQKQLLPWFQRVLETASHRGTIETAEAYLREWLIDPVDYYKALAVQLGVTPTEISPTYAAQAITPAAPTIVQAAQAAVSQKASEAVATVPQQVYVAPPAPVSQPLDTTPAPAVAPQVSAPATREEPAASTIDWGKWAMPVAVIAAALISANSRRLPSLADDESEAME